MKRILYYSLLISLSGLILFNLKLTITNIIQKKQVFDGSNDFPGAALLPLSSYLKDVRIAGYYADYAPLNPDTDARYAFFFQRAQFALVPTILDHIDPWKYEYVIVCLYYPSTHQEFLKYSTGKIVAQVNEGIFLIRQNKV